MNSQSTPLSTKPIEGDNSANNNAHIDLDSNDNNVDMGSMQEVVCGSKKRHTSRAWNHFKKLKIDNNSFGQCNYCGKNIKAASSHGTNTLLKHIDMYCPKRPKKIDIRQSFLRVGEKDKSGTQDIHGYVFDQETARHELAYAIIIHEYPLSIVNHIGFRRFVNSLQPSFKMVSRNTIKSDILKIYDVEKSKISQFIQKVNNGRVAITTDMWTSSNNKNGFMVITAHFIDESWTLQSCILRFVYVPSPHTKEVISDLLVDSLLDWNIDRNLSTVTVDNCSTNDAMINLLGDKLSSSDLLFNGSVLHMRCCAHILNLIVKDGREVIGSGIERIRDNVVYWSASQSRIEKFEEAAKQLNITCTKKLSLDCKTRWNSTYLMLQVAISYKEVFFRARVRERNLSSLPILPTDEDWQYAIMVCEKLKVFYQVTEMFSGTLYPTANWYFPKICDIKIALHRWSSDTDKTIREMALKMLEKYTKYWDDCHILMGIASVLDPRYKLILAELYFNEIFGETRGRIKLFELRQNCYDLLNEYQSKASHDNNDSGGNKGHITSASLVTSRPRNFEESIIDEMDTLAKFDKFVANQSHNMHSKSELDLYLEEPVLPRKSEFDILGWWKTNGVKYPILQRMAKDILAIPVSTVASESAFSTSGRLLSPHRSRLTPKTLEALMCARNWLWDQVLKNNEGASRQTILDEEEEDGCVTE